MYVHYLHIIRQRWYVFILETVILKIACSNVPVSFDSEITSLNCSLRK